jgi:ABC-type sugar transport system ATPase subunit
MSDLVVVMNEGVVQQIGTPEEVYAKPANLFVAGFIGTPPMNLLPARNEGGTLTVAGAPLPIPVPAGAPAELILGVRPQDVTMAKQGESGTIPGQVWMVELIGSERLIEVEIAPKLRVTAEVRASHKASLDEAVAVRPDPAHVHLFDPGSGRVLTAG